MKKRRKVWIVTAFTWDILIIEGIFSTKKKAEAYAEEIKPDREKELLSVDIDWRYLNEGS